MNITYQLTTYEENLAASPVMWMLSLGMIILIIIATWKIYVKAGFAGWSSLIPFYNIYILFKITWGNGWFFLLTFIPFANIVIHVITMNKLAKAFGKGELFTVGLILFGFICLPILGFGNAEYREPFIRKNTI